MLLVHNPFVGVLVSKSFEIPAREGEGGNEGAATGGTAGGATAGAAVATPAPVTNPNPLPSGENDPTKFTPDQQKRINALLAEERRKTQESNKATVIELERLKSGSQITEQEKERLQLHIDELTATFTTKEQQQQSELQKLQKQAEKDIKERDKKITDVTTLYHNKLKDVALVEAATENKAISVEQIKLMLWNQTVIKPEFDEFNKPTGGFVPKVNFIGIDKEGKDVQLELSPKEAVKKMTEMVEKYGNLFEGTASAGLGRNAGGSSGPAGGSRIPDINTMSTEQWKQYRKQIREKMAAPEA